eukprot:TRINITY_DN93542_c0_g1_i1.p1 TRINITY_DN93542_c0_g1~~TRINITY_DN93542_c0_g1_i1.p1  ORF type:complete len:347 (-),score=60.28 TRINITY_DN93542_c0_g1_i1:39-1010(-)
MSSFAAGGITAGTGLIGGAPIRDWPDLQHPRLLDLQQFLDCIPVSPLAPAAAQQLARRAYATAYPPHWSEELDAASGALYFYNYLMDESSWEHPMVETYREVILFVTSLLARLPADHLCLDELVLEIEQSLMESQQQAVKDLAEWVGPLSGGASGQYFHNRQTGESSWADPRERWQYDLQVRYDLLVGFLVAEEKGRTAEAPAPVLSSGSKSRDITTTLTSLASSMVSVASTIFDAMPAPGQVQPGNDEGSRWAEPRSHPRSRGSLALPPRATGHMGRGGATFYQQQRLESFMENQRSPGSPDCAGSPSRPPPPPPPTSPPRR